MARPGYGPPALGGPGFPGDDDELLRRIQLHERGWMILRLYQCCRERYLTAEATLDHATVLGLLAAGEESPPEGALLDVHDVFAAAWRRASRKDNPNDAERDDPDRGLELTDSWLEAGLDEFGSILEFLPELARHVLIAAVHHGSPLGETAENIAAAKLLYYYDFPVDRVTEVG